MIDTSDRTSVDFKQKLVTTNSMAPNLHWIERAIAALHQHFCSVDDNIETKRKQCILVGTSLVAVFTLSVGIVHSVFMRTFWSSYPLLINFVICLGVIAHCRITRSTKSAPVFLAAKIYVNVNLLVQRGGFTQTPHFAMLGLLTPILALFLCPSISEQVMWTSAFVVGNAVVHVLELNHVLRVSVLPQENAEWANFLNMIYIFFGYYVLFWFAMHVYTAEKETRKVLQKERHLFMRLSHEVRTPVTVISATSEMMQEWPLNTEQRVMVGDLAGAARRLASVMNDLQAFYDSPAGGNDRGGGSIGSGYAGVGCSDEECVQFNVRDAIDAAVGFHLAKAEAAGLSMYVDIADAVPLTVVGTKSRLVGIFDHLVGNAVKFTPSGSVTIQAFFSVFYYYLRFRTIFFCWSLARAENISNLGCTRRVAGLFCLAACCAHSSIIFLVVIGALQAVARGAGGWETQTACRLLRMNQKV